MATRMPRYDVRNDGAGPYAVFYCDMCSREFRSQPDVVGTVSQEVTQGAARGLLRNIPIIGSVASSAVQQNDPRYIHNLTPQQLEKAWAQFQDTFHECPVCHQVVCPSDWDAQAGTCEEDSPRKGEIARAQAEQAAGALKGFASALGLGGVVQNVGQAVRTAGARAARCPRDGTLAAAGTKFCPQCGSPMVQPALESCAKCGADVTGMAFCPQCGAKVERQAAAATTCAKCGADVTGMAFCQQCGARVERPAAVTTCPNCGASVSGARFCPSCGTKVG